MSSISRQADTAGSSASAESPDRGADIDWPVTGRDRPADCWSARAATAHHRHRDSAASTSYSVRLRRPAVKIATCVKAGPARASEERRVGDDGGGRVEVAVVPEGAAARSADTPAESHNRHLIPRTSAECRVRDSRPETPRSGCISVIPSVVAARQKLEQSVTPTSARSSMAR